MVTARDLKRTKTLAAKNKKLKHKLVNKYHKVGPEELRAYLEHMKTHGKELESETINAIDDEAVKTFILDYYNPPVVPEINEPDHADGMENNNNQPDDVGNDDVVLDAVDLQQDDSVEEEEVEEKDESVEDSDVSLRMYESGEDCDKVDDDSGFIEPKIDEVSSVKSDISGESMFAFLDEVDIQDYRNYDTCVSNGITRLEKEKGIKLKQLMVDPTLLRMYTIAGKKLSPSKYTGYAPPVSYAPFNEFVDPFLAHDYRFWGESKKRKMSALLSEFRRNVIKRGSVNVGWREFHQKFSFLLTNNESKSVQVPHTDVVKGTKPPKDIMIGFMPLLASGLFLEVWKTHKPGEEQVKGDIVFVSHGTMLLIDSSVVHAGGIGYNDEPNLRMQFAFSNKALPIQHTQYKGILETEYVMNNDNRVCLQQVCDEFSSVNPDTRTFNH